MKTTAARVELRVVAVAVAQMFCVSAYAADEAKRIEELEKRLAQSMLMIEQLSTRLGQLEVGKVADVPANEASANTAAQAGRLDRLEETVLRVSESSAKSRELGIPLHGFADVGFAHSSRAVNGRRGGFTLGNLDLYMTPEFGDRVKSIFELVFEYGPDNSGVATDLERLQFGYTFSDAATVWAGRFHTPYGYWNTAFHHGQQIQTAATRPRFIEFEDRGGFLPAHAVGLLVSGAVRSGAGKLQYDGYLANGNRIADGVLDFNAFKDNDRNKLVGGNVRYAFGGSLDGLTLGLHGFTQHVGAYDAGKELVHNTRVNMAGGFAVLDRNNWEVIGEYYRFRNGDLTGQTGTHASWAGFGQAAYTFADKWTPYARYEKASLDDTDNYFSDQESGRSYTRGVIGLRYNLSATAAIKFELDRVREKQINSDWVKKHEARLQFAVRF